MPYTLNLPGVDVPFTRDASAGHASEVPSQHCILDPPWCGRVDLIAIDKATSHFCPWPEPTPVLIAGKDRAPDEDARQLASRILSSPHAALSPLLQLDPSMGFGPDEWMLSCIWFPYQTYRACWYVGFASEYGEPRTFAFRARDESPTCDSVEEVMNFVNANNVAGYCQDSFTSVPSVVSWIVRDLFRLNVAGAKFNGILTRIETERLYGTELVDPLLSVAEESKDRLPQWLYSHYEERLRRCLAAIATAGS